MREVKIFGKGEAKLISYNGTIYVNDVTYPNVESTELLVWKKDDVVIPSEEIEEFTIVLEVTKEGTIDEDNFITCSNGRNYSAII